jgi:hypothetical protein
MKAAGVGGESLDGLAAAIRKVSQAVECLKGSGT